MKIGIVQMRVTPDKNENLRKAREGVLKAAEGGARVVMLPEMFVCPFDTRFFRSCAEPAGGRLMEALGLPAPIHGGLRLGEGSGAVMLLPLLDMALSLYHSGQGFDRLGIEAYTPQNGG